MVTKQRLLFILFLFFLNNIGLAIQNPTSQESKAEFWYKLGLTEREMQKKIDAYSKAIELDPTFVDALHNLGQAYDSLGNHLLAEKYLKKAFNSKHEELRDELKLQILYELASAQKHLGKKNDAVASLRLAKEYAQNNSNRAQVLLELGTILLEQNRFTEAIAPLEEGEPLDVSKQQQFSQLLQMAKQGAKTNGETQSVESIRTGVDPNQNALQTLYDQALKYENDGNWALAATVYENIWNNSGSYRDIVERLKNARAQVEKNRVKEIIAREYADGVLALQSKKWIRAIFSFEKVLEQDPDYADTSRKLREAKQGLSNESDESIVSQYYAEGLLAMKQENYSDAHAAFEKVYKKNANYRNATYLLKKSEAKLAEKTAAAHTTTVDSLRKTALAARQENDWVRVVVSLELLQTLEPDDENVKQQLQQAQAKLQNENSKNTDDLSMENKGRFAMIGGILIAILVIPVIGLLIFSPTTRARIQLLRGNYTNAGLIYEKILTRNPDRVKLYPTLANIYLLSGRQDPTAINVYKTVLRLNLPIPDRDRIQSMLAQKYVTGATNGEDAIDVLEQELQKEFERKRENENKKL